VGPKKGARKGGKQKKMRPFWTQKTKKGYAERARRGLEVTDWTLKVPNARIDVFYQGGHDGGKKRQIYEHPPTSGHF